MDGCIGLERLAFSMPMLRKLSLRGCKALATLEVRCRYGNDLIAPMSEVSSLPLDKTCLTE